MTQTGWRKPTPGLVRAEKFAQAGERLSIPKTQAITAAKKVAAAIGLKAQDMLLLDTFGAVTQPQDWEQGRRPIVWASNNFLMEQTGFSLATLKRHARRLCEAGIIAFKDSPNGKRYGSRDEDGYIAQAYGFDLSPLAARAEEFELLHEQLREERQLCKSLRNTITITRRAIYAKIEKALDSRLKGPWRDLQDEFAMMLERLPKRTVSAEKLIDLVEWFKALRERVEDAFEAAFDWPEQSDATNPTDSSTKDNQTSSNEGHTSINMNPSELKNEPHILTTNQPDPVNSNSFETKHAAGTEPKSEPRVPVDASDQSDVDDMDINWGTGVRKRGSDIDIPMLMVTCPHFAEMARTLESSYIRDWNDLHRAAAKVRGMAGISEDAWNVANRVLGPQIAAATIALIYDKYSDGEVQSAGGYLRGMVKRAQAGELHLNRSFYGRMSETSAV